MTTHFAHPTRPALCGAKGLETHNASGVSCRRCLLMIRTQPAYLDPANQSPHEFKAMQARRNPPLKYHFAKDPERGTSICGTPGMIGTLDNPSYPVTCKLCLQHAAYQAAVRTLERYTGS